MTSAPPICRARLTPVALGEHEVHVREGRATCEERARLAAHYFDVQLESYARWQPELDEHFVWLARHCPALDQTCLLTFMAPSLDLDAAWTAQADAHPTSAHVHANAEAVRWQTKRAAQLRDEPRLVGGLAERARAAFEAGDLRNAEAQAIEALLHVALTPPTWNTGNLVHHAHATLGRIALRRADLASARRHLLASGRTSGSPQLHSFGPTWDLAAELLAAGEADVVVEYLELCKGFWPGAASLDEWQHEIRDGGIPAPLRRHP